MEGEERERTRMARELHDGIVSRLSVVKMNLSTLPQRYSILREKKDFEDAVTQLEQSIGELRTTSHNLLPEILQQTGLVQSLIIYCNKISKIAPLDLEFQLVGALPELAPDFQLNIYRILQEIINNILKHSRASHALIQFHVEAEELNITIDDNGAADLPVVDRNKGIGLQNLDHRVKLLEGTLSTEQTEDGTSVYLSFHLKKFSL